MDKDDLIKELKKRGTAEISNGIVNQVTQAIDETASDEVEAMFFGEIQKWSVKPIEECCAKCRFWKDKFESIDACKERQKTDAEARGFKRVICPEQLD